MIVTTNTNRVASTLHKNNSSEGSESMTKVKQLLAAAILVAAPFMTVGVVSAEDCTIENTGPGSTNVCETENEYTCTVNEDNSVTINLNGEQVATSGDATSGGNTSGGGATSGSATNENGTTFEFDITNEGCVVTSVTEPTTETPVTPTTVTPEEEATPTVLANTASDGTSQLLVVLGAVAAAVALGTLLVSRVIKR